MSGKGWIKLHRKIRDSSIFNDHQLFRLWMICLTEATHKERDQIIGKQTVHLMPGEFVTGRFDIKELYNQGLKPKEKVTGDKTVFRWLETLESGGFLTIKKTNKFSVVSIDNWDIYQGAEVKDDHQIDQQMTNKRPSNDQQMTTNKNVKNDENEEEVLNDDDKAFAQVVDFYQRNIGTMPPSQYEYVKDWLNTFDSEVLNLAIRRAIDNGVPKWSYVNQTLNEWQRHGAKSIEDCKTQIVEFDRRKGEQYGKYQESHGRVRSGQASRESEYAFLDKQNRTGS